MGSHSYGHLLYFPWEKTDRMNVTKEEFFEDMQHSYALMRKAGIKDAKLYMPPYEHYNATVTSWARQMGLDLMNYTNGTATNGDYTIPDMKNYYSSDCIMERIWKCETADPDGLNGHILLIHPGTSELRSDKFYDRLDELIGKLLEKGYTFTALK